MAIFRRNGLATSRPYGDGELSTDEGICSVYRIKSFGRSTLGRFGDWRLLEESEQFSWAFAELIVTRHFLGERWGLGKGGRGGGRGAHFRCAFSKLFARRHFLGERWTMGKARQVVVRACRIEPGRGKPAPAA